MVYESIYTKYAPHIKGMEPKDAYKLMKIGYKEDTSYRPFSRSQIEEVFREADFEYTITTKDKAQSHSREALTEKARQKLFEEIYGRVNVPSYEKKRQIPRFFTSAFSGENTEEARAENDLLAQYITADNREGIVKLFAKKCKEINERYTLDVMNMSDEELVENYLAIKAANMVTCEARTTLEDYGQYLTQEEKNELIKANDISTVFSSLVSRMDVITSPYYSELNYERMNKPFVSTEIDSVITDYAGFDETELRSYVGSVQRMYDMRGIYYQTFLNEECAKVGIDYESAQKTRVDGTEIDSLRPAIDIIGGSAIRITAEDGNTMFAFCNNSNPSSIRLATPLEYVGARVSGMPEALAQDLEYGNKGLFVGSREYRELMQSVKELKDSMGIGSLGPTDNETLERVFAVKEAAQKYLRFKEETGKKGLDGKNRREKTRIAYAKEVLEFAEDVLTVSDGVNATRNTEKVRISKAPDYSKINCPESNLGNELGKLRNSVTTEIASLANVASLRPEQFAAQGDIAKRAERSLAKIVSFDLVLKERGGKTENIVAGPLETALHRDSEAFVTSVQNSEAFKRTIKNLTPARIDRLLIRNEIQNLSKEFLANNKAINRGNTALTTIIEGPENVINNEIPEKKPPEMGVPQ